MIAKRDWTASAARVVVTPPAGLPMGGYDARVGHSLGTADELEVNLLALGRGGRAEIAWVAIDSLAVTDPLRKVLVATVGRLADIDSSRIVCFASHTHSAPVGWVGAIHPVLPAEVDPAALEQVALAIDRTELTEQPVSLHLAETEVANVGANRHHIDGPHDQTVATLTVRHRQTGEPLAVMYDFACHPTVLGPDNRMWSADWVGGARRRIRERLGPALPILFQQGSAGDVSPRFHRQGRDLSEVRRLGGIVGDRVAAAAGQTTSGIITSELHFDRTTVVLPRRDPATVNVPAPTGTVAHERLAASFSEGARSIQALAEARLPTNVPLPISRLSLGERSWLHLPVELCSSYGLELRKLDRRIRVIGYTDGYAGYVADAAAFWQGHYEASSSFFDLPTSTDLIDICRDYLRAG